VNAVKAELAEARKSEKALQSDKTKLEAHIKSLEARLLSAQKPSAAPAASPVPSSPPPVASTPPPPPKPVTAEDQEIEQLRQAIAKNPKDIKSMLKMAQVAFAGSRFQDAIEPLTKAVRLQPKDAELFFMLGDAHQFVSDQ
jgi:tetratricopeptide (TPR) repeat protein